jgi:hypothetical protein
MVDFDVNINTMSLNIPEEGKGGRGRMNYVKLVGPGDVGFRGDFEKISVLERGSFEEWCRMYCENSSSIKKWVLLFIHSVSLLFMRFSN